MPRRLLLALLILVAAPLVLLGWVSASAMADSQERAKKQLTALLQSRLAEIDRVAAKLFDGYALELTNALSKPNTIDQLQVLRRENPIVRQGVFVSSDGQLLYPPKPSPDDPDAVALYATLPGMVSGRSEEDASSYGAPPDAKSQRPLVADSFNGVPPVAEDAKRQFNNAPAEQAQLSQRQVVTNRGYSPKWQRNSVYSNNSQRGGSVVTSNRHQWQVWYMDQGMQLILWLPRQDGASVGIILERPRWTSDLIASLPESENVSSDTESVISGFTALMDESNQIVYRWGDEGEPAKQPVASIPMSSPLSAWEWHFHSDAPLIPKVSSLPLIASLTGIAIVLLALGGYVLTSVQRQMRVARNRVSFAGQVSHELRTPLTNIRLYAELAESDLEELPPSDNRLSIAKRLKVIDAESKRLGRLVSGVLEMIRDGNKQRGPRLAKTNPNQLIDDTLSQFAPSFEKLDFDVTAELCTDADVEIDADIFEIVLVNLLSNVEKYASDGKFLRVRSWFSDGKENDWVVVSVQDHGPGINDRHHEMIFRPFTRLDDSISAPSGTGIGLTIARNAADRHGGQLEFVPCDQGSCFEFKIPISRMPTTHAVSAT